MMTTSNGDLKRIESKLEIDTFIQRLKYSIKSGNSNLMFQKERLVDSKRSEKFTNWFTVAYLFPDEDPVVALKKELQTLTTEDYIETIKDKRFVNRSEMRVFGKKYTEDVYIKIRVELMKSSASGVENHLFVMSFHFSEYQFRDEDFPYKKRR